MDRDVILRLIEQLNQTTAALREEANRPDTPPDPRPEPPTSNVIRVRAGQSLQAAVNSARGEVTILVEPSHYAETLELVAHDSTTKVTIQPDVDASRFPLTRVESTAPFIVVGRPTSSGPAIQSAPGTHNYTLIGVKVLPSNSDFDTPRVILGYGDEVNWNELPRDITLDRCYITGHDTGGGRRGVGFNVDNGVIKRCLIDKMFRRGRDTQAVQSTICRNVLIEDNALEASGENIMFGGADPRISGAVPQNIVVTRNLISKPSTWRGHANAEVKNLFEVKNGTNIEFNGNRLRGCWRDGQDGTAIQITVRNQDGGAPWSTISNVRVTNNIIEGVEGFLMNVLGVDDTHPSVRGSGLLVRNNRTRNVWNGIQIISGMDNISIEHNLMASVRFKFLSFDGTNARMFRFTDNVVTSGEYGIVGNRGLTVGKANLDAYVPGYVFAGNLIERSPERAITYPINNLLTNAGTLSGLLSIVGAYSGPTVAGGDDLMPGIIVDELTAALGGSL